MPSEGYPYPLRTEPPAKLLPELTSIDSVGTEAEDNSGFYRDAGVLAPTHEQIAQRAYELYLASGRIDGYEQEDWLEAEKQLSVTNERP
jgi:Protein of unknown function (DUF2934)